MWEVSIRAAVADYKFMCYMEDNLKLNPKNIVALQLTNNFCTLSVASDDKKALKKSITQEIAKFIAFKHKEKYFKQNITLNNIAEDYKNALIKALVLFDVETDAQLIYSDINFKNIIDVNSLYYFKLKSLKNNWKEMINLANKNACFFFTNETFLELIKFLIESMPKKEKQVNVFYENNNFKITNTKNKPLKNIELQDCNKELSLVSNLIFIAPEKINLYCINNLSNTTFKILYHIFNKNINLQV